MTTISLRVSDEQGELFKNYAQLHGISVSELVKQSVLEKIEDELDLTLYNEAMEEYKKNPVTYSHEEVRRMFEDN